MVYFAVFALFLVTMTLSTASPTNVIPAAAYKLKSFDEKYTAVLKEMGYPDDVIKLMELRTISVIRVAKDGDNYIVNWALGLCERVPEDKMNLKSGEEYDVTLCDGRTMKAVTEYNPEKKQLTRTIKMDGFDSKEIVSDVSDAGMKLHYHVKDKEVDLDFEPYKIE